ncbi:hypothetical protein F4813DRAFT_372221 [Daldinia decipiens]|uniref:uncharacterized protein n=1 Tax=Daldinia decipiens TaxID=326647 RepID=UPI0020C41A95|nr:uncharacterized protein F4813DRAFT_372221 [Daldinia decipiens]KAI1654079.1 hypothetical protein F4813DRAFT_372221 [Daldinia decipiens]
MFFFFLSSLTSFLLSLSTGPSVFIFVCRILNSYDINVYKPPMFRNSLILFKHKGVCTGLRSGFYWSKIVRDHRVCPSPFREILRQVPG